MKKWKLVFFVSVISVFLITMSACQGATSEPSAAEESAEADSDLTFAFLVQGLDDLFILDLVDGAKKKAEELGITLLVGDGEFIIERQLEQAESFIVQGVDLIILQAFDMSGGAPVVERANEAGIPIVLDCTSVDNALEADGFVGSDNVDAGRIQGEYLVKLLDGKAEVGYLRGPLGSSAEINRTEGFMEVIKDYPGINIVVDLPADWSRDVALEHVENWLNAGRQFDAIIAQDDGMALGASIAVTEAGLKDDIFIMGIDAIEEGLMGIKEGKIDATVFQPAFEQGYQGVEFAYNLITGATLPEPKDEYVVHPVEIIIPFVLVTPDDVDKYLK